MPTNCFVQAGDSDKKLEGKLMAEAAAFAALDPEAAAAQMPRMQVGRRAGPRAVPRGARAGADQPASCAWACCR